MYVHVISCTRKPLCVHAHHRARNFLSRVQKHFKSLSLSTETINAFYFVIKYAFLSLITRRPKVFCEKQVLKTFAKFRKTSVPEPLFDKIADLQSPTLLKKRLQLLRHRCFPVNFVRVLSIPFSQNSSGRLLQFL